MTQQTMKNLDKLTSMRRVNEFCMLLAGNDHGKWLPFHELHKGEFIRKLKFLNAQRVSMKYLPYPQDVQGILDPTFPYSNIWHYCCLFRVRVIKQGRACVYAKYTAVFLFFECPKTKNVLNREKCNKTCLTRVRSLHLPSLNEHLEFNYLLAKPCFMK